MEGNSRVKCEPLRRARIWLGVAAGVASFRRRCLVVSRQIFINQFLPVFVIDPAVNPHFWLYIGEYPLDSVVCFRYYPVLVRLECPKPSHISFETQVGAPKARPHIRRGLQSFVMNPLFQDITIFGMPCTQFGLEFGSTHMRDAIYEFQQLDRCLYLRAFSKITPYSRLDTVCNWFIISSQRK